MTRIEPRSIIRSAWTIYTQQAGVLLPVAFALYGVSAVISFGGGGIIASIVGLVISTFYQGMVVQLVRDVQDGRRDSSPVELLQSVTPVVGPLLAVSILSAVGISIGLLLLIVPGLYLLTIWAVVAPVTVIERPGAMAAFGRSQSLVRGHGWPVFTTIVLVFLISFVLAVAVLIAAAGLAKAETYLITWVVQALTAPMTALTGAVLYFALAGSDGGAAGPVGVDGGWQAPQAPEQPDEPSDPDRPASRPPPGFTG